MKIAKLSLAAIMVLGVSAFAEVQNIKVTGSAKLYYSTDDQGNFDLFDKNNPSTAGQAAASLSISGDLVNGVAGKVSFTGLSTMGLENNLVGGIWAGSDNSASGGNILDTQYWMNEAWLAKKFWNTTIKIGRQELDTPLAFSEKWNIAANSFDAAVVLNEDIPDTTLVAAWVGRGNGAGDGGVVQNAAGGNDPFRTYGSAIDEDLAKGAYVVAAITKAIPMTTAQAWYYNVVNIAQAFWVQADIAPMEGLTLGLQYANINPDSKLDAVVGAKLDDSNAWGVKVGYELSGIALSAAFSQTDEDGAADIANTATGLDRSQSKLYTEAWWNYGYVGAPDTTAWSLAAEYSMEDIADFGAYLTSTSQDETNTDMNEFTLTASKDFGNLNATLAYIYTEADDMNNGDDFNTIQVYLTYNF